MFQDKCKIYLAKKRYIMNIYFIFFIVFRNLTIQIFEGYFY